MPFFHNQHQVTTHLMVTWVVLGEVLLALLIMLLVVVEVLVVLALMQPLMDWELPVEMEEHFLHFLHL
jgi:hypothetical protein